MSSAVCPGSFDPFTLGHLDVVRRACGMFDRVIVAVAKNPAKYGLIPADRRAALINQVLTEDPGTANARAEVVTGLVVDYCRSVGATAIVKGLRGGADLDAETPMALMNRHLTGIETVFVLGDPALSHIASSLVKDVAHHGGDITDLIPEPLIPELLPPTKEFTA